MSDPEIAAMTVIATALADLDRDAQLRVTTWAAERFGVSLGGNGKRTVVPLGGAHGAGETPRDEAVPEADEASIMTAVSEETGVPVDRLERVIHIDAGVVKLIGPSSKYGSTTTEQARSVIQIVTVVGRVGMGRPDTAFDVLKEACESKHCYDHKNFSTHHVAKLEGFVVKGEGKSRRLEAKRLGISAFADVIDSILGEP